MTTKITSFLKTEKVRLIKTLAIYLAFITHGLGLGVTGPSMLDLQISTASTLEEITWMIIGRAFGLAVGSLLNTFLHRVLNVQLLLAVSLTIAATCEAYIPYSPSVWVLVGCFFVNGMAVGIVDTCCNAFIIQLWGSRCPSFLQALHFCFGFGAFISPLLVRPFLLPLTEEMMLAGNTDFTRSDVKVHYAYLMIAVVMAIASLVWWYIYLFMRDHPIGDQKAMEVGGGHCDHPEIVAIEKESKEQAIFRYVIYITSMLFMFFYDGVEIALGSYLTPFAVKSDMHLSKATGALMSSTYWITFTFARLTTIFYIDVVGPRNNLIMALSLVAISNIFLVPFGNTLEWALWVAISLNGIGMSSIWASLFAFISQYMPVTDNMTSLVVSSACLGECVIPIIVSAMLEKDVMVFLWVTLACSVILILLFVILFLVLHFYDIHKRKAVNGGRNISNMAGVFNQLKAV